MRLRKDTTGPDPGLPADPAPAPPAAPERLPLTTLGIAFGLAGLAEVWSKAAPGLHLPRVVTEVFWALTAVVWVVLLVAHAVRGMRSGVRLTAQLRHPSQGPLSALAPVVGMLVAADLFAWVPLAGRILYFASVAAAATLAVWTFAWWFEGRLTLSDVHSGYMLPTVAPGLIGGDVGHLMGYPGLAWALFGIGTFFGAALTPFVIGRLLAGTPLPDALLPTVTILLAPPAVCGVVWFTLNGHTADPAAYVIMGVTAVFALLQVAMLPRYRRLRFSLGFWSFTFPIAGAVALTMQWLQILEPAGWRLVTGVLAGAFTAFVAVIVGFTVPLLPRL